jgi:hypothetical protein
MWSFALNAQFTTLWYCFYKVNGSLYLNISVNARERFSLTDFWIILFHLNKQRIFSSSQLEFVFERWIARKATLFFQDTISELSEVTEKTIITSLHLRVKSIFQGSGVNCSVGQQLSMPRFDCYINEIAGMKESDEQWNMHDMLTWQMSRLIWNLIGLTKFWISTYMLCLFADKIDNQQ